MEDKTKKERISGRKAAKVLGATFETGKPAGEETGRWRQKLKSREERLKYLQTGERYWYGKEWFGSEKRKTPA